MSFTETPQYPHPPTMWLGAPPDHLLPAEILSVIFVRVMEIGNYEDRVRLMLVCRRWHAIVLSTPGIPSRLQIDESTEVEQVRATIQGAKWFLDVIIGTPLESNIVQDFNADAFDACFMAAIKAASRWKSLHVHSIPQSWEFRAFQIVPQFKNLEVLYLDQGYDRGRFFELLMAAIVSTAIPHLRDIDLRNDNAVLYLVQPDRPRDLRFLTSLTISLSKRMERPIDILPYFQRLEEFDARHLYLPIYPPDYPLPLTRTLRSLSLKSVSVQWMAGKVFPVLWRCKIIFPHQFDTIYLHPVTLPTCTSLGYKSNDLGPLRCFYGLPLADLAVASGQWSVRRGNLQLVAIHNKVVLRAQSLTRLDFEVRCSEQLLVHMLSLLPALVLLQLRLTSPRALNETFFQKFVVTTSNADSPHDMGALARLPLCLRLVRLVVNYKRWLRGPERMALLPVFSDIVSSRLSEVDFQLHLSFEDLLPPDWAVRAYVESVCEVKDDYPLVLGISIPHGIIPLVSSAPYLVMEVPFKEAECLVASGQLSTKCLLTLHHLVELRVRGEKSNLPSGPPNLHLPLFHTLRVFEAGKIHHSFLAGQTFHSLERCRIHLLGEGPKRSEDQVTQMPVCTRLDVDNLNLLATLKLPQIRELGASFNHPEFNLIWEKHIAVNANLSGLELLHVYGWYRQADLIQALRCLPVLKYLILANGSDLDAAFFGEFVPTHPNETTGLVQSHHEGQVSAILCPMLRSLLIEECGATERVEELIPVLKRVVTLREECGSPLERFNLASFQFGREFELVGSEGGFITEMESLDEDAESFELGI